MNHENQPSALPNWKDLALQLADRLDDISTTAHCISKAGPLNTRNLQEAWNKFDRISVMATAAIGDFHSAIKSQPTPQPSVSADARRMNWLAAHCYREGGNGRYAPVYAIASSEVWPVAGHALTVSEKEAAFRNAIDEASQLAKGTSPPSALPAGSTPTPSKVAMAAATEILNLDRDTYLAAGIEYELADEDISDTARIIDRHFAASLSTEQRLREELKEANSGIERLHGAIKRSDELYLQYETQRNRISQLEGLLTVEERSNDELRVLNTQTYGKMHRLERDLETVTNAMDLAIKQRDEALSQLAGSAKGAEQKDQGNDVRQSSDHIASLARKVADAAVALEAAPWRMDMDSMPHDDWRNVWQPFRDATHAYLHALNAEGSPQLSDVVAQKPSAQPAIGERVRELVEEALSASISYDGLAQSTEIDEKAAADRILSALLPLIQDNRR